MKVDAASLHRLLYNSLLFDTKSAKAYEVLHGKLRMNTSDGHVYIEDWIDCPRSDGLKESRFIIGAEASKTLELALRASEGEVSIGFPGGSLKLVSPTGAETTVSVSLGEYAQQSGLFWEIDEFEGSIPTQFAFNPDRLRKLALLQPRDYPVDTKVRVLSGQPVLVFKKGPNLQGIYGTLDRDYLRDDRGGNDYLWP